MKSPRAFTLIELLVVIAIIAILMGLLFPAVQAALNAAKKAKAKNDVVQISNAVTAFEMEYGRLPSTNSNQFSLSTNANSVLGALMGTDTNQNPRKLILLEVNNSKNGKNGLNTNDGTFRDPWGNAYQIKLDTDYDNTISNFTGTAGPWNTNSTFFVRKKVAVWSTNTGVGSFPVSQRVGSWD